ncbi:MAG: carbohydrate ABC transporter substrate-binding protein [Clostridia bacterium]|nr:carbohydrate ABC transporter substrate-binding protein [Clostridia bacterium]
MGKLKIMILIGLLLLTTGCQYLETSDIPPSIKAEIEIGEEINLYYPSMFGVMTHQEEWEKYIEETFGYHINLIYFNVNSDDFIKEFEQTDFNGFVYLPFEGAFLKYLEKGVIIPLNEYILDYTFNNKDYQSGLSRFMDNNGNLYGIPTSYRLSPFYARQYDKTLLESYGISPPETIDEFTLLASILKDDGIYISGFNDNIRDPFTLFTDIMLSYGCYFDGRNLKYTVYNPKTKQFEDTFLKSEFKEAVNYIKWLEEMGYILRIEEGMKQEEIKIASYIVEPAGYDLKFEEVDLGLYLKGSQSNHLVYCEPSVCGFAVLKNTQGIDSLMRFMFEDLFINPEFQKALCYGIKGYHYDEIDSVIYVNSFEKNGTKIVIPSISVSFDTGIEEVIYRDKKASNQIYSPETKSLLNEKFKLLDDEMLYESLAYCDGTLSLDYLPASEEMKHYIIYDVLKKDTDIDELITLYKDKTRGFNMDEYLQKLNSHILDKLKTGGES